MNIYRRSQVAKRVTRQEDTPLIPPSGRGPSRIFGKMAVTLVLPLLFATSALAQTSDNSPSPATRTGSAKLPVIVPQDAHQPTTPDPIDSENRRTPLSGGSVPGSAHKAVGATEEVRGMWVTCDSLDSPASVHQVVVTAKKYHLNTIFVQVRSRGDAWYNSPYEPRAEGLREQPKNFDPLAQIVEEAHQEGLQIHAWLNTYLTWSKPRRPRDPNHLWNAHRDWFAHDRYGRLSTENTEDCEGVFLQPSNPAVQQHLYTVFTDVAARYDVDGIHFDFVRYANSGYDFSDSTLDRFREYMRAQLSEEKIRSLDRRLKSDRKIYVHTFGKQWEDWRRAQVTQLVTRISETVKTDKPWMQVSAAVFPDGEEAAYERGQDWMNWLRCGVLDSVSLMAYNTNTAKVAELTRKAVAIAGERHVYTGIGAWRLSAHDVASKISQVRKAGAAGINLFSYDDVHERSHYLDTLARGVFASRSAPPRMRWLPSRQSATTEKTSDKSPEQKEQKSDKREEK